jgi:crossover junction endodeoxyribonuclease RusA
MPLLNCNDRDHWSKRAKTAALLRQIGRDEVERNEIPCLDKVRIRVTFYPPNNRRRDSPNVLFATSKPIIDGIVDAGVLKDDSDKFVRGLELVPGDHVVPAGQVVLEIWEVEE